MDRYTWLEINIHANGVVRIYGNSGLLFEAEGENVKTTSNIFPKQMPASGEAKVQEVKK